jgi:N-dimethylarginine dimethylaminohydrolase
MERVMCPPTYLDIEYSINPWMDVSNKVDKALAFHQWNELIRTLTDCGDTLHFVEAAPGLPDMTFSGDAGLVWQGTFIPSNFRCVERQGEVKHYIRWFEERGYPMRHLPGDLIFEGLGDVVFHDRVAVVGYGIRSDERCVDALLELMPGLSVAARMEIVDDRYFHLAMALGMLDFETALYYPPAFTDESVRALRNAIKNPLPVSDEDANGFFACNNLVLGNRVILDDCTKQLRSQLREHGFEAVTCGMSEFKKAGGSLRCLVLTFMK